MPRKKIDPDAPVNANEFDTLRNRANCGPEVCNFKVHKEISRDRVPSTARGHLYIMHGFSSEQINREGSKANEFLKKIVSR